jgi:hypothetical protein
MRLTRSHIRRMILETIIKEAVRDEPPEGVIDLSDPKYEDWTGDPEHRITKSRMGRDTYEDDSEFEEYLSRVEAERDEYQDAMSQGVTGLFGDDPADLPDPISEDKGGGAYSGYFGMEMPYGDEIDEGDEEDQSQHMLDLQLQLQKDVEGEKTGGTIARQSVRQDQQAIANLADK